MVPTEFKLKTQGVHNIYSTFRSSSEEILFYFELSIHIFIKIVLEKGLVLTAKFVHFFFSEKVEI